MRLTMRLRVATRGSALALRQTETVCGLLRGAEPGIELEAVIIQAAGDLHPELAVGEGWPVGGFTGALERALLAGEVDLAVHSLKDLPVDPVPGLTIAATPGREVPGDVLVSARAVALDDLPAGWRVGTSSPRRTAQVRARAPGVVVVPMRGNVPTRLEQVGRSVDGAVLAWAGLRRLGVEPAHLLELPLEEFPPAPGQGALAVQARQDGPALLALLRRIHDPATWTEVSAERAFLRHLGGGCHAPAAALGRVTREGLELHGQIFGGGAMVSGRERGADPLAVGAALAERLAAELREAQR